MIQNPGTEPVGIILQKNLFSALDWLLGHEEGKGGKEKQKEMRIIDNNVIKLLSFIKCR